MQGSSDEILDKLRTREVTGIFHSRKAVIAARTAIAPLMIRKSTSRCDSIVCRSLTASFSGTSGEVCDRHYDEFLGRMINLGRKLTVVMALRATSHKLIAVGDVVSRARKSFLQTRNQS
jgi:hypothetical protein